MKIGIGLLALELLFVSAIAAHPPQQDKSADSPPEWAYPVKLPDSLPVPDSGSTKQVSGNSNAMTQTQAPDPFNISDPQPDEHPAMPEVVKHGRKPSVLGCAYCHLPNGLGGPQNSSLAGLPASYIVRQMAEFKSGARKSSQPKMGPLAEMIATAEAATNAEVQSAAEYFSSLKRRTWVKVVETDAVPKTHFSGITFVPVPGGGNEPIGNRISETAEKIERTALPPSISGFVAYVPVGSIRKGQMLVTAGAGGRTVACALCHGPELRGLGSVPPIAGRSPSYIFRQLYDIQHGTRNGEWGVLMKAPVTRLSNEDMVSIAAYLASLTP